MINEHPNIHFFFRLLNIGIMLGLILFFFRRYGLPALKMALEQMHAHVARLTALIKAGKEKLATIQAGYREREDLFETLKKRLERLTYHRNQQHELVKQERQALMRKSNERITRQTYLYMLESTNQALAPQIVAAARTRLQEEFSDESRGRAYLATTIRTLQKKSIV